jgi:tRNA(Ile)-lysidine synthase
MPGLQENRERGRRGRPRRPDPVRRVVREVARAAGRLDLPGHTVVVAVSGGLDSTVLAHVLVAGALRGGFRVAIAHVHHGLRGAEADADQASVEALAGDLGVPFAAERIAPQALREGIPSRRRPTLQEAARELRYAALGRLAAGWGAERIATAHHADDQAETVLLRLLRGSGPDGLGGIPERSRDGRIVRPLLRVPRSELACYARQVGLTWREDSSNASERYTRNRLRRGWIPGLAAEFNPRLLRALADLAEAQRRDSEWIRGRVEREVRARFSDEGSWLRIDTKDWQMLPEALSRRLVRAALIRAGAGRHVERVHLERVLSFLARPSPGRRIELPGGLEVRWTMSGARLGPLSPDSAGRGENVC